MAESYIAHVLLVLVLLAIACVHKLYPTVQSCCSILSHETLKHCLNDNNSLEMENSKTL